MPTNKKSELFTNPAVLDATINELLKNDGFVNRLDSIKTPGGAQIKFAGTKQPKADQQQQQPLVAMNQPFPIQQIEGGPSGSKFFQFGFNGQQLLNQVPIPQQQPLPLTQAQPQSIPAQSNGIAIGANGQPTAMTAFTPPAPIAVQPQPLLSQPPGVSEPLSPVAQPTAPVQAPSGLQQLGNFLFSPAGANVLSRLAQAITARDPSSFGFQLGAAAQQIAEGQQFKELTEATETGQPIAESRLLGLSPELRREAIGTGLTKRKVKAEEATTQRQADIEEAKLDLAERGVEVDEGKLELDIAEFERKLGQPNLDEIKTLAQIQAMTERVRQRDEALDIAKRRQLVQEGELSRNRGQRLVDKFNAQVEPIRNAQRAGRVIQTMVQGNSVTGYTAIPALLAALAELKPISELERAQFVGPGGLLEKGESLMLRWKNGGLTENVKKDYLEFTQTFERLQAQAIKDRALIYAKQSAASTGADADVIYQALISGEPEIEAQPTAAAAPTAGQPPQGEQPSPISDDDIDRYLEGIDL